MVHDACLNSLRILAHLEVLPPSERRFAAETAAKLAEALVYLAVIGEFKRGKSTLGQKVWHSMPIVAIATHRSAPRGPTRT
jgi:hypothetical protein